MLFLNLCKAFDSGREESPQKVTASATMEGVRYGHTKLTRHLKDVMNGDGKKE